MRCWDTEAARARVREACALAWSAAGESSPEMEAHLRNTLPSPTRPLALAIARRASVVHTLSGGELLSLLGALGAEPPWIRAQAARTWLEKNKPLDIYLPILIWHALALPAEAPDPLTASAGFAVARKLGFNDIDKRLGAYCPAGTGGAVLTRCLRLLSALVDPRTGDGLDRIATPYLPAHKEPGALLFERSFPERARLLERYL